MNSTYWLNKIMDTMYNGTETEFYIGLSSTKPNSDGSGVTEPTENNYARVKIEAFTPADIGMVKNPEVIEFPRSTGTWFDFEAKAAYWVLFDGSTSEAHLLSCGELDEPKTIESNTSITIAKGTLSITLTDYRSSDA